MKLPITNNDLIILFDSRKLQHTTDYHFCCSEKNIDNPFMKLSTACTSLLTHVFHCHGCEDSLCQEFKKDLLHALTCIDESMMNK